MGITYFDELRSKFDHMPSASRPAVITGGQLMSEITLISMPLI